MPCQDLSEIIELTLSPDYKLLDYSLRKLSCDKEIGKKDLILHKVKQKTIEEILEINASELISGAEDTIKIFLYSKHLQILQLALGSLIGIQLQGKCSIDKFEDLGEKLKVTASISKDQKLNPCDNCRKCK